VLSNSTAFFVVGVAEFHPLGNEYDHAVSVCGDLCAECGGQGNLDQDVCLCVVPQSGSYLWIT